MAPTNLSPEQLSLIARIQRERKSGFLPSLNDVDGLIAIVAQLLASTGVPGLR